jgi:hypothetical protein
MASRGSICQRESSDGAGSDGVSIRVPEAWPNHPANRSDERDVIDAAGVILPASDGAIQYQRTYRVKTPNPNMFR